MLPRIRATIVLVIVAAVLVAPLFLDAKTVDELRQELEGKRQQLKEAEERISKFKEDIQIKRQEARTLAEQISLMDANIQEIELSIDRTLREVETTNLQIEEVRQDILVREEEIAAQKIQLIELIRAIYVLDQQSTITIFLKYDTLSEAVNEAAMLSNLRQKGQETLTAIQTLRDELATKQRELEDFKQTLEALQKRQEQQQATLETQRTSKARILELTNQQETQFQSLLQQSQQTHREAEAEIRSLDTAIREELKKQGYGSLPSIGVLDWPIEPIFGISCPFHCAGYPYAYLIGAHSGIDVPTYVGTPIKAPADGYVARLHDSGGSGYSYILLLHGENVSTVYGHVSGFAVSEGELVTRGTVIGYTGGAPGTHGSGLSTGPHLHFEVRVNNSPTDPMKYL